MLDCVKEKDAKPQPTAMFNPKVVLTSDDTNVYEEGCLSIPEQYAEVTRPKEVKVEWIDLKGNPRRVSSTGCGRPACSMRSTIWMASCSSTTLIR